MLLNRAPRLLDKSITTVGVRQYLSGCDSKSALFISVEVLFIRVEALFNSVCGTVEQNTRTAEQNARSVAIEI